MFVGPHVGGQTKASQSISVFTDIYLSHILCQITFNELKFVFEGLN